MRILLLHLASTSESLVVATLKLQEAQPMRMLNTVQRMVISTSLGSGHKVGGTKVTMVLGEDTMELGELGEERLK